MRNILVGLVLIISATSSMAQYDAGCYGLSRIAEATMVLRQTSGNHEDDTYVQIKQMLGDSDRDGSLARLVVEAYDKTPRYFFSNKKEKAIDDFRNEILSRCLENKGR